ncbi:MAG: HNH endonuclease [Gemmataceae bacterium]|nr:HNH endonuclease [Gemmataceae bacterium]
MTPSWAETCRRVAARAGGRCGYRRMHQALQGATFHVEHTRPTAAAGSDDPDNLALACPGCNLKKADRVSVPDPDMGAAVPLFNPRLDRWADHFAWDGPRVEGLTPTGRGTAAALALNHPRRVLIREAEQFFDLFPPDDEDAGG